MLKASIRSGLDRKIISGILLAIGGTVLFYFTPFLLQGGVRMVLAILAASIFLVIVGSGQKGSLGAGVYVCVAAFAFGQRTLHIGSQIRITPAEAIAWLLFLFLLFYARLSGLPVRSKLPLSAKVLAALALLAIFTSYLRYGDFQLGIAYGKLILLLIPAFYVAHNLVESPAQVKMIARILSVVLVVLSFLGVAEYFRLGFIDYLPGFFTVPGPIAGQEGFARAVGSFWGGPMLSAFLVLLFPLSLAHLASVKNPFMRILFVAGLLLSVWFIYSAGHRGIWMAFLVSLLVYAYFSGARRLVAVVILVAIAVQFLPTEFFDRIEGLYGAHMDSSSAKRYGRALDAVAIALANPLGAGWGATGLVHSDFLQVAGDCGIPALAAWLLFYWWAIKRLKNQIRLTTDGIEKRYMIGFAAAIAGFFIAFLTEAYFNLPEYWTPFWFVFALGARMVDLSREKNEPILVGQQTVHQ